MIVTFDGNYDKQKFYSLMGEYFAEVKYRKELPYIKNNERMVWFLYLKNNKVIGFSSLEIFKSKIVLTSAYVDKEHRGQGIFRELTEVRFKYIEDENVPIEFATNNTYVKEYMIKQGFKEYKKTTNYIFMRKDVENE